MPWNFGGEIDELSINRFICLLGSQRGIGCVCQTCVYIIIYNSIYRLLDCTGLDCTPSCSFFYFSKGRTHLQHPAAMARLLPNPAKFAWHWLEERLHLSALSHFCTTGCSDMQRLSPFPSALPRILCNQAAPPDKQCSGSHGPRLCPLQSMNRKQDAAHKALRFLLQFKGCQNNHKHQTIASTCNRNLAVELPHVRTSLLLIKNW